MPENPYGLSPQDVQDLRDIATHLPAGDPRMAKVSLLLNSVPTQFEQERDPANQKGFLSSATSEIGNAIKSIPSMLTPHMPSVGIVDAMSKPIQVISENAKRKQEGYSVPYRAIAGAVSTALPVANVNEMEHQADVGNARGVLGTAVGDAAMAAAPAVAPKLVELAKPAVSRALLLGKTPAEAYESALKASTAIPEAKRAAIINTAMDEGIPVSKGGMQKVSALIDDLNQRISAEIQKDPTRKIDANKAIAKLDEVRNRFANQVTPQNDLAAVDATEADFRNNPKLRPNPAGTQPGTPVLNADEAQAMKQGTYRALGDKAYGELKGARIESEKALARGLKDEIAAQFPEIAKLNARESGLLDLQPVLEKAVNRIGNHQLFGIGTPVAAGAAGTITGNAKLAAAAGAMKAVLDNPMVKSRLAISLSKAGVPYGQAVARIASYQAFLGSVSSHLPSESSAPSATDQTQQTP